MHLVLRGAARDFVRDTCLPGLELHSILDGAISLANALYGAPQNVRFIFEPSRMDIPSTGTFYNNLIYAYVHDNGLTFDRINDVITPSRRVETTQNLVQHIASRIAASRIAGSTRDTNVRALPINTYNYTVIRDYFRDLHGSELTEDDLNRIANTYIANINTNSLVYNSRISRDFVRDLERTPVNWSGNYFIESDNDISFISTANSSQSQARIGQMYSMDTMLLDVLQEEVQSGNRHITDGEVESFITAITRNYYRALGPIVPTSQHNVIRYAATLELARRIAPIVGNRQQMDTIMQHLSYNLNNHSGIAA